MRSGRGERYANTYGAKKRIANRGKFKVVNGTKKEYKGDKNEKAKIFFKRKRNKNKRRKK